MKTKTIEHTGCPQCLEKTEIDDRFGKGKCDKCGNSYNADELVRVGEKNWRIRIIRMNSMEVMHDRKYNDQQLMRVLLEDDKAWQKVMELEGGGVKFTFGIEKVTDYHNFVRSYLESREHFYREGWVGKKEYLDFEVVDNQSDPAANGNAGKPDFTIECTEEDADIDGLKDNLYHLEFKYNGDSLNNSQLEWMLEKASEGYEIRVMKVESI